MIPRCAILLLWTLVVSCALFPARAADEPTIAVTIEVDFGRFGKAPLRQTVAVAPGSNVVDATRAALPVEQDVLCCSKDDVWSIGGVGPDVRNHAYWSWRLNGGSAPSMPAKYIVKSGDTIQWNYGGRKPKRNAMHRVVSLVPAATDIVLAIGAEDALVAVSHLCAQPTERSLPRVVTTTIDSDSLSMIEIDRAVRVASAAKVSPYGLDEATITSLSPTLVLSQGLCPVCAVPEEQAAKWSDPAAAPCAKLLTLTPRSLADVANDIRRVGEALEIGPTAAIVARDFERRLEGVRSLVAARAIPRPTVVVLEWFEPLWVSGEWVAEMVEVAGGEPKLATARDPSRRIEWSDLVATDPDVIVLAACSMDIARATRERRALTENTAWRGLRAVSQERVFLLDGERHFSSPGPGLARGTEILAGILSDPGGVVHVPPDEAKRITRP